MEKYLHTSYNWEVTVRKYNKKTVKNNDTIFDKIEKLPPFPYKERVLDIIQDNLHNNLDL